MAVTRLTSAPVGVPRSLRIVTVEHGATSTIELEGEWDLAQRDATRDAVSQALQRHPDRLVLDLSRLSFIDLPGVHALIDTHKRCTELGTRLMIVPGQRAVRRVFEICDLIEILPFAAGSSSALTDTPPTTTREVGGPSLHPQRRRRSVAQATGGASPRAPRK